MAWLDSASEECFASETTASMSEDVVAPEVGVDGAFSAKERTALSEVRWIRIAPTEGCCAVIGSDGETSESSSSLTTAGMSPFIAQVRERNNAKVSRSNIGYLLDIRHRNDKQQSAMEL